MSYWVVDANIAVNSAVNLSESLEHFWNRVTQEQALHTIHALRVEIIDEDKALCLRALELAGILAQSKAYDAFYLAVAEKLGLYRFRWEKYRKLEAEFWTADQRLYNRCRDDLGLEWVHWINEL